MTRRSFVFGLTAAVLLTTAAQAQPPKLQSKAPLIVAPTAAAEARVKAVQSHFGAASRAFISRQAAAIAGGGDASEGSLRARIAQAGLGPLSSADIDALVEAVMMQAAQDSADDLRAQMNAIKAATAHKDALRQQLQAAHPAGAAIAPVYTLNQPGKAALDAQIAALKSDLDSMSDMSESDQLRLQLAMDRMSKLMQMLSNLMKKTSDTESAIVGNLK